MARKFLIPLTVLAVVLISILAFSNPFATAASSSYSSRDFSGFRISENTFVILDNSTGGFKVFSHAKSDGGTKYEGLSLEYSHNPQDPQFADFKNNTIHDPPRPKRLEKRKNR